MSKVNQKTTSAKVASLAGATLSDPNSSGLQRRLAASVLSQAAQARQTGADLEGVASRALLTSRSDTTQTLAASLVAQANKSR